MIAAALAALAVVLAVTGPRPGRRLLAGIAACATWRRLLGLRRPVLDDDRLHVLAVARSCCAAARPRSGVFWGAPLVARELEAGTHRLVWNQSVTRTRWLAIKLGRRRPGRRGRRRAAAASR